MPSALAFATFATGTILRLSGATPAEAVSWGKIDPAKLQDTIVCYCDTTIALPLVTAHPDRVGGFVAVAPVDLPAYESALRKLALPTLIVWGERDAVVPVAQANALHTWVKDSQLVILKGAGHPCYLDRPEEFHAALIAFVRSATKGRAS